MRPLSLTTLAVLACAAACEPDEPSDNMLPEAVKAIPEQRISVPDTARVATADHFADPEGGALAYAAESSAPDFVTAAVDGGEIVLVAIDAGMAEVTVTATDSVGAAVEQTFTAHALNDPPEAVGVMPDLALVIGGEAEAEVDLADYFADPNGDALAYEAPSTTLAVRIGVAGSILTVVANSVGSAQVEVLAVDPDGESATSSFSVSVREPDREALEILYDELGGDGWADNTNWKTDRPLDEWYGVSTNAAGRVDALRLGGNNLRGELPPELGELSSLWNLDLDGNSLTGEIPADFLDLTLSKFYWWENDGLCAPSTAEFDDWLDGISWEGDRCD